MIIYFALFIPVLVMVWLWLNYRDRIQWWEPALVLLLPIICVFGIKWMAQASLMYTTEYWNSYGTKIEYYEAWDEYIHRTCSRTYACGTDSEGNTTYCTEYYDCSYVENHSPYWVLYGSSGEEILISKEKYEELMARWRVKPTFKDMQRSFHSYDGDMYFAEWPKVFPTMEPIASQHQYKNKVKPSKNTFGFVDIDPKKDSVLEYKGVDGYTANYIYNWMNSQDQLLLRQWNSWLGRPKKVVMMIIVYDNKDISEAFKQESYWRGGNKNELILCVGKSSSTITWTKMISWTPQTILKAQLEREIKELHNFCMKCIINHMGMAVEKWPTVIRRDFEEFNYLTVPVPLWGIILAYIVALLVSVGAAWFVVTNDDMVL
jgi:hypothetical protein